MPKSYRETIEYIRHTRPENAAVLADKTLKRINEEKVYLETCMKNCRDLYHKEGIRAHLYELEKYCYEIERVCEEKKQGTPEVEDEVVAMPENALDQAIIIEAHKSHYEGLSTHEQLERTLNKYATGEKEGERWASRYDLTQMGGN